MSVAQGMDLQAFQRVRKVMIGVGLAVVVALALVTRARMPQTLNEAVEALGLGLILVCIVGRAWCSLYIGGRKKIEIVDRGPYSISRNPLYVFSFMGAFGVGAQTGSLVMAGLFLAVTMAVFYVTVRREEAWLGQTFGETYRAYCARTPRFGPRFSRWRDAETLDVQPRFFLLTLRDGLIFLLAIPVFKTVEVLQEAGWLHTLLHLP